MSVHKSTDSSLLDIAKARDYKYDTLLYKYKCRSKPIVYTTRLDDMNIIAKNILHHDMLRFIKCIIKESKPMYNGKQVHPEAYVNKLVSYSILKSKINMYNAIVKSNTIKKHQVTQMKNKQLKCDNERTNSIEFIQLLPDRLSSLNSKDDFTITEKVYETMGKLKNRYPSKKYIIIKNHNSKETDIYFFNIIEDVIEHYKSKDDNYNVLKFYYNNTKAKEFNHCCWYQSITDIMSNTTVQYLRKQHKCTPGNCKCCCNKYATDISKYYSKSKKKTFLVVQPKDPLLMLSDNSESNTLALCDNDSKINNLPKTLLCKEDRICGVSIDKLQGPLTTGNLIKKALNYSPLINLNNFSSPAYQTEFLKHVIIEISNDKSYIYECYKIGSDGEIEDYYIKQFENSENYNKEQINILNNDAEYNKIPAEVCCWYARKNFIDQLSLKKLLPSSLKFMVSSLNSYKKKCENCEILSQTISKSNNHIDLTLPKHHVFHSSNQVIQKFKLKINVTEMTQPKSQVTERCSLVEKNINQNINSRAPITCTTKIQHTPQSHALLHPGASTSNTNNIMTKPCTDDLDCKADSTEVKILINTILEKFKGVQLFVNENGKISAQFNSSVNTLNVDDIQMLNQIIEQAQSELDALGSHKSQIELEKPLGLPQFTSYSSTLLGNVMQQNLSTQKNNNNIAMDELCLVDNASSFNEAANTAIVNNDTSTIINNTLLHGEFLSLMKEKREHYLKAFECYLMTKQDSLGSIIESVPATKRIAKCGKGSRKRIKVETGSKLLQLSKIDNPEHKIIDNVPVKSTKYNDNRNTPGASKMVHIPKPVAIIPSPHLQNLLILKAPTSTLHSEHTQETTLSSDKSYASEIREFSNPLTSGIAVNIHDTLFKVEESTLDDAILGI